MSLLTDLSAHWKLNEASGTRNDAHGTNHLTDNNTVTSATGKVGDAGDFETDNSEFLSLASNSAVQTGDTSFCIAGWFQLESKTSYRMLVAKDPSATTREYLLYYDGAADRFSFAVWNAAQTLLEAQASALGSPSVGTWYFIVAWFDTTDDKVKIQINDGTVNESSASAGFVPLASTNEFTIGAWAPHSLCHDGLIDSVSLWKRTLTTQERTDLYNSGNGLDYESFSGADPNAGVAGYGLSFGESPFGTRDFGGSFFYYGSSDDAVSETLTAADAQTVAATFNSSAAESLSATDAPSGVVNFAVAPVADTLAAADAPTATLTFSGAVSETLTAAEAAAVVATFAAAGAESLTAADAQTVAATFSSGRSESLTATESLSATALFSAAAAESLAASETATAAAVFTAAIAETLSAAEICTGDSGNSGTASESVSTSETAAVALVTSGTRSEALSAADGCAGAAVFASSTTETLTAADGCSAVVIVAVSCAETLTATDTCDRDSDYVATAQDLEIWIGEAGDTRADLASEGSTEVEMSDGETVAESEAFA